MISVSFLKSNYNRLETIKKINETDADLLHVDIMDGKFLKYESNNDLLDLYHDLKYSNKPLDIHLMVLNPFPYIEILSDLNIYQITIHVEIKNVEYFLNILKEKNIKCGLAINPETNINEALNYNPDYILIMGVKPGLGGQKLIDECVNKRNFINDNIMVGIDGGVNLETIERLKNFDIIVSGSYICTSNDYQKSIDSLR